MLRDLELKGPSTIQLMIIINSEQALAQQPAGSGRMPGSPTVRSRKQDPRQPCMGVAGWDSERGQTGQCQGVAKGDLPCEGVGKRHRLASDSSLSWIELTAKEVRLEDCLRRRASAIQYHPQSLWGSREGVVIGMMGA